MSSLPKFVIFTATLCRGRTSALSFASLTLGNRAASPRHTGVTESLNVITKRQLLAILSARRSRPMLRMASLTARGFRSDSLPMRDAAGGMPKGDNGLASFTIPSFIPARLSRLHEAAENILVRVPISKLSCSLPLRVMIVPVEYR